MYIKTLGLIGFGEAGAILAQDIARQGVHVQVYDKLQQDEACRGALLTKAQACGVRLCASAIDASDGADLVMSAVTAGAALEVALHLMPQLRSGQVFMDLNSVAPATKKAAHQAATHHGVDYVDAAVMAPLPPQRLKTPMLLGGPRALELETALKGLGLKVQTVANTIGVASSIKMCRSIMIKGLEALTTECMATARQYGAEDFVLASLHESFPGSGWDGTLAHYLISRVAEHGFRRAEEMEEVARTVSDVGMDAHMSLATAATQRAFAQAIRNAGLVYADLLPFDWAQVVDQLQATPTKRP